MQRLTWWLILLGSLSILIGLVWRADRLYQAIKSPTNPATVVKVSETLSQANSPLPTNPQKITFTVPILMFHYIRDYTNSNDPLGIALSVSPSRFQSDLEILKTAGYQTISLEDYYLGRLKPKSIILTFDDGYDNHYLEALPILSSEGMTGTFFIIHGFIGMPGYVSATNVKSLAQAGMEIGDHTVRHRNLAALSFATAYQEIIGGEPGMTAPVFAYPSGEYNQDTVTILRNLHFHLAVTTKLGIATNLSPLFELPRIRVKENTDVLKVISEQLQLLRRPPVSVPSQAAGF